MGGVDGCVYEMAYEGNSLNSTTLSSFGIGKYASSLGGSDEMERAIDDYFDDYMVLRSDLGLDDT